MRVRLLLFAAYRELLRETRLEVDLPDGATAQDLYRLMEDRQPHLAGLRSSTTFAVNREVAPASTVLRSGDEVAFLQPASGGQPEGFPGGHRVIELRHDRLSLDRCVEAVRRPGSGGIVTFVGSVRDTTSEPRPEGLSRVGVRYLEYEAYEPMAVSKLEQVIVEACEKWPVMAMAIQHRLGRLEIGEDAVIVAVSCPHRAEAFAACRYAIDRLKEIVPIWKKEYLVDGEVWVGGPGLTESESSRGPGPD